jgi:hypothetical protein
MDIRIEADRAEVDMGRTVGVSVLVKEAGHPVTNALVLSYVNGRRWGAHERTDSSGRCALLLPLPNPGTARIQVEARPEEETSREAWIWAAPAAENQRVFLQKTFVVEGRVRQAVLHVAVDNACDFFLNGEHIGAASGWNPPTVRRDLAEKCRPGENTLSIAALNGDGPAGVLVRLTVEGDGGRTTVVSNETWRVWTDEPPGWPNVAAEGGTAATRVCGADEGVWAALLGEWPGLHDRADWITGRPVSEGARLSNEIEVTVRRRAITRRPYDPKRIVGVQWEPWFMPHVCQWQTAQAVPLMGFYNSDNVDVIRQHALWLAEAGIDFVLADWSNHIWGKQHWSERDASVEEIINATTATLETYAAMRDEGIPVPKMVLMPGLSNGPPTTMEAINEELDWVYEQYMRDRRFEGLWLEYEGKPLIVILDCGTVAQREKTPVDDTHFTVRWMSTQLQATGHEKLGYWSWMDGGIEPVTTYCQGEPEVVTVSTAFFGHGGWLYPEAYGRRGGATYVETFKPALALRPRFLMLHQWNEFAGQPEGQGYGDKHDVYVDSYSFELSDDIEPVSLTSRAYRGEGGWGFYYLNLTRALVDLYCGDAVPQDTLLAVSRPLRGETVRGGTMQIEWATVGKPAAAFLIDLDGQEVARVTEGCTYALRLRDVPAGAHVLKVTAADTQTRYPLSFTREDDVLEKAIPAAAETPFVVERDDAPVVP